VHVGGCPLAWSVMVMVTALLFERQCKHGTLRRPLGKTAPIHTYTHTHTYYKLLRGATLPPVLHARLLDFTHAYFNINTHIHTHTHIPGCCAVQRFRQRYMPGFWIGVRGFEVLDNCKNLTFQSRTTVPVQNVTVCTERCQNAQTAGVTVSDEVCMYLYVYVCMYVCMYVYVMRRRQA
jgi:hypothetical protein